MFWVHVNYEARADLELVLKVKKLSLFEIIYHLSVTVEIAVVLMVENVPSKPEFHSGVTVYFIPRIFYPGDSIYYPADSISLVYFIPRQDILSLHGDQGMSQNISVATQSSSPAVQQSVSAH